MKAVFLKDEDKGRTSSIETTLLNALMSKPLVMAILNTVRSSFVPQNMSLFSTSIFLVVEENAHLHDAETARSAQQMHQPHVRTK